MADDGVARSEISRERTGGVVEQPINAAAAQITRVRAEGAYCMKTSERDILPHTYDTAAVPHVAPLHKSDGHLAPR